jgi:catalase
MTAGARGPLLAQDLWLNEKLANFVREVIPERRMHAKGSGAFGTFTVTNDITQYSRAKIFSEVGKKPKCLRVSQRWRVNVRPMQNVIFAVLP